MRVLMHCREDWRDHAGGDVVQARRWLFWLNELGIEAHWSDERLPSLQGFDLIHVHNLSRAASLFDTMQHAQRHGTPIVLTTLYWPADDFERWGRPGWAARLFGAMPRSIRERIKTSLRWWKHPALRTCLAREWRRGTTFLMRDVLAMADRVVVVSQAEAEQLQSLAGNTLTALSFVPSGIDADYWSEDAELGRRERMDEGAGASRDVLPRMTTAKASREGMLCVGRFDPQKGQHRLIRAVNALQLPLTLVGTENPNYPGYRRYCERMAGPSVRFLPPQARAALIDLYRQARMHVQASWYELSSLSALEAAASGCQVVTTAHGGMRDYFGQRVWYIDPHRPERMLETIQQAWESPVDPALARHVRQHWTWRQSAVRLIDAYRLTLERLRTADRAA